MLQLVLFLTAKYIFDFLCSQGQPTILLSDYFDFAHGCICVCVYSIILIILLPNLVTAICLGFIFGFSFLDICFNLT